MTLTQTEQDMDAEKLHSLDPGFYAKIEKRITQEGETPEHVEKWLDMWFGWPKNSIFRLLAISAAHSIYRKHKADELEAAQEALSNICTGTDPARCDDPKCKVHTKEHS